MKEFIKSLSPKQLIGLVEFSKEKLSYAAIQVIQDHLDGNSEGFKTLFGFEPNSSSKTPPSVGASEYVKKYTSTKIKNYNDAKRIEDELKEKAKKSILERSNKY